MQVGEAVAILAENAEDIAAFASYTDGAAGPAAAQPAAAAPAAKQAAAAGPAPGGAPPSNRVGPAVRKLLAEHGALNTRFCMYLQPKSHP